MRLATPTLLRVHSCRADSFSLLEFVRNVCGIRSVQTPRECNASYLSRGKKTEQTENLVG